jgi:hypothetical protein
MTVILYIVLGLGGLGLVLLLNRYPQLALPALAVAAVIGGAVLLLSQ